MSVSPRDYAVVLTTAGSADQAASLARELVERRLAACVSILEQACSVFRWKGEVSEENEKILVIKTRVALFPELRETIRKLHSYECPEILMLPVADGDASYLSWIDEQTRSETR